MSKAHKIINVKNITPDILESIKYTYTSAMATVI